MKSAFFLAFLLILFFVLYVLRGGAMLDPDFGWHIQAGNHILKYGISSIDPFSYSMPQYPFIDHEWLTNLIWANLLPVVGYQALVYFYALICIAAIMLQIIFTEKKWVFLPVFLIGGTLLDFVGVRTQVIDWLFLSVLLIIVREQALWEKWRFFLPLLFLLWANVHGGFGIGLGVLGVVLVVKGIETGEEVRKNLFILCLCILITLINPFGIRLWWEFWMQLSDTQLRLSIMEWYPAIYFPNIAFWVYWTVSVFLVVRYRKKYSATELVLYCFLLVQALLSIRNIPLWLIASFVMTAKGLIFLKREASRYKYGSDRFRVAYIFFSFIAIVLFSPQLGGFFYGLYFTKDSAGFYPQNAITYLHKNLPHQQIFSSYDWGGYLIWQLPEKKVFIDGRMPSWRWQANIPGESNYAFDEYKKVLTGKIPFSRFVRKYHITTLLVAKSSLQPPEMKLFGIPVSKNSPLRFLFYSVQSFYLVAKEAKKMGWHEVYNDNTAVIFQAPGQD
jgi:hypothetical protein